jgi:hypothetical protein
LRQQQEEFQSSIAELQTAMKAQAARIEKVSTK